MAFLRGLRSQGSLVNREGGLQSVGTNASPWKLGDNRAPPGSSQIPLQDPDRNLESETVLGWGGGREKK